jgi:hypothetical protein
MGIQKLKILPLPIVKKISGVFTGYTVKPTVVKQTKIYYGSICLKIGIGRKI